MKSYLLLLYRLITYNVKVIFANKFVYFVLAAFLFFGFIIMITIIEDPDFNEAVIYGFLVFPGLLLIFYPMAYGIQNDDDSKMLETIFGIPNYRYKVWLVRFVLTIGVAFVILLVLGHIANLSPVPVQYTSHGGSGALPYHFSFRAGFYVVNSYQKWEWYSDRCGHRKLHLFHICRTT